VVVVVELGVSDVIVVDVVEVDDGDDGDEVEALEAGAGSLRTPSQSAPVITSMPMAVCSAGASSSDDI
jgi:hypothetical protein